MKTVSIWEKDEKTSLISKPNKLVDLGSCTQLCLITLFFIINVFLIKWLFMLIKDKKIVNKNELNKTMKFNYKTIQCWIAKLEKRKLN